MMPEPRRASLQARRGPESIDQRERYDILTGVDSYILLAVKNVGHRRRFELCVCLEMPELPSV
jgi:hypothetical protein